MRTPHIAMTALALGACFGAGWITSDHTTTVVPSRPVATVDASARARIESTPRPGAVVGAKQNYLPAGFEPNAYDKELLAIDDEKFKDFVAHGLRDETFDQCHHALRGATDATCQKIYEATARVSPKFVETRKRLLRGEIDATTFQSLWHQLFLERSIALEQFLSWDDQLALDGVPPGNDMFMALDRWGRDTPDGFKIGLENPPEQTAENP